MIFNLLYVILYFMCVLGEGTDEVSSGNEDEDYTPPHSKKHQRTSIQTNIAREIVRQCKLIEF